MKEKIQIFVWVFLLLSGGLEAQVNSTSRISKQTPDVLTQAAEVKDSDPIHAIQILENALGKAKRAKNTAFEADAYHLLGNIYEDINRNELALQRYEQSQNLAGFSNQADLIAKNYLSIGRVKSDLGRFSEAENDFKMCVSTAKDKGLSLACQEGLADIAILRKDFEGGKKLNDSLMLLSRYYQDSLFQARGFARNAEILANQNQFPQAQQSYLNSIENIPEQNISFKDYQVFDRANTALKNQTDDIRSQLTLNIDKLEAKKIGLLPVEIVLNEQLQLADLYIEEGNFEEAEKIVEASKELVKAEDSPALKAEVFRKSSELNSKRGAFEAALADYESYIVQNGKVLEEKEEELNNLTFILKGNSDIDLIDKDVALEQKDESLGRNQVLTERLIIGFLSILLAAAAVFFYFIMKNVRAKRKANQMLLLKSLRTQMNPHFIFNALNSVNSFISKNDEKAANKFLADFSRLMRMVLDYSQKDFISLEEELNLNELYLKLEHLRFRDKFEYKFEKNIQSNLSELQIPPMLVQPFIENAVWHGLRYKKEKGLLKVLIEEKDKLLTITVEDDGIGRKKSLALKTQNQKKYKSTGLKNVGKRVDVINELYGKNYQINTADITSNQEETGTIITINIPLS